MRNPTQTARTTARASLSGSKHHLSGPLEASASTRLFCSRNKREEPPVAGGFPREGPKRALQEAQDLNQGRRGAGVQHRAVGPNHRLPCKSLDRPSARQPAAANFKLGVKAWDQAMGVLFYTKAREFNKGATCKKGLNFLHFCLPCDIRSGKKEKQLLVLSALSPLGKPTGPLQHANCGRRSSSTHAHKPPFC